MNKIFILICILSLVVSMAVPLITSSVYYYRKSKHQKEWNALKRQMELENKSEGDIRSAYFEYCKKLVQKYKDFFGWGIPEIGYINIRRGFYDTETVAE